MGMEIFIKGFFKGYYITEIPATCRDRTAGESQFRLLRRCHGTYDGIALLSENDFAKPAVPSRHYQEDGKASLSCRKRHETLSREVSAKSG